MENLAVRVNSLLGQKLASIRRAQKLSQTALGQRVNLSRITIANIERGTQNVQLHQVFAFAQALQVGVDQLLPTEREVAVGDSASTAQILELLYQRIEESMRSVHKEHES